jgi:hypothetical protein
VKKVLKRILGPRRDEVTRGWKTLHNEELHNPYFSPDIIRMIKLRRLRWTGHIVRMGEEECMHIGHWLESQKERDHYEYENVGGWIILRKMYFKKIRWSDMDWIDLA